MEREPMATASEWREEETDAQKPPQSAMGSGNQGLDTVPWPVISISLKGSE
jgi:hypothetical protein